MKLQRHCSGDPMGPGRGRKGDRQQGSVHAVLNIGSVKHCAAGCAPVGKVHQHRQNIRGAEGMSVPRDQGMHPQHSRTAHRPF